MIEEDEAEKDEEELLVVLSDLPLGDLNMKYIQHNNLILKNCVNYSMKYYNWY